MDLCLLINGVPIWISIGKVLSRDEVLQGLVAYIKYAERALCVCQQKVIYWSLIKKHKVCKKNIANIFVFVLTKIYKKQRRLRKDKVIKIEKRKKCDLYLLRGVDVVFLSVIIGVGFLF